MRILPTGVAMAVTSLLASAQTASTSPTAVQPISKSDLLQAFQVEQQAQATEFRNLRQQGATEQQLQAWFQQKSARIAAQQKLAQAISTSHLPPALSYITDVNVSPEASQTMEDFLVAQADFFNLRAQIRNQQIQSSGTVDEAQVEATFQQQNRPAIQAQIRRIQILSQEADQKPRPEPPPLAVPAGASEQTQAFLILRNQLLREQIQLHNQSLSLSPAARAAAMQQWMQQNTSRFEQLASLVPANS